MPERDVLEVDVLVVGGGPAGLAAAIRLAQLQKRRGSAFPALSIAVLEKARVPGGHSLSGAVMDPSALAELIPDFVQRGAPLDCPVTRDELVYLTPRRHFRIPITPPPLVNRGNFVISLASLVAWLSKQAEELGVEVLAGFGGSELLLEDGRVVGVRTSDRGRDRQGAPQSDFVSGPDVRARVTILCDGVRGNLTKQVVSRLRLDDGRLPQAYSIGLKELWKVPPGRIAAGHVTHTLGFPLASRDFGGGFVYGLPGDRVSVGLVAGLASDDPLFDPHHRLQAMKLHPFFARLLEGGSLLRSGAKALPEGGWHSIPRLHADGVLIAGDAAGFLNSLRLKGIHLAMRSGMIAADTAFDALAAGDVSRARLSAFDAAIASSAIHKELYPVRNVHQAFERGRVAGILFAGLSLFTNGWWFRDPMPSRRAHERMQTVKAHSGNDSVLPSDDESSSSTRHRLVFDKATSVHFSGARHREDAPSHLIVHDTDICRTRCTTEFGNPCTHFCPANVYEMVPQPGTGMRLQINASNCVHCKMCDIVDPYQIIDWVPPEGGDGPSYEGM